MCSPFPPDAYTGTWGNCRICGKLMYTPKGKDPVDPCEHVRRSLQG